MNLNTTCKHLLNRAIKITCRRCKTDHQITSNWDDNIERIEVNFCPMCEDTAKEDFEEFKILKEDKEVEIENPNQTKLDI